MQQVRDFLEESETLARVLQPLSEQQWSEKTQFKDWTFNEVIIHIHFWNRAADLSLNNPSGFQVFWNETSVEAVKGGLKSFENSSVQERGPKLLASWQESYRDMASRWKELDPKVRVKWAGPEMSARSSVTARQMETWAHGQAVFDQLGQERMENDRIRNIVILGVNTFGWSFKVRGMEVPAEMPCLRLTSPSGEIWSFGEENSADAIEGSAAEFCRVVTQTRNIADTSLSVIGETAGKWMNIAQCFAGPPEEPPPVATRYPSNKSDSAKSTNG